MKALLLTLAAIGIAAPACAQREVPPQDFVQPGPKDLVIGGEHLAKDVTCETGTAVYIEGGHNEVQVHGACSFVRIQGERNYVWVDRETYVPVEGNNNVIFVSDTKTRYSSRGNGNRFEKGRH